MADRKPFECFEFNPERMSSLCGPGNITGYLARYLGELNAKSMVVEHDYVDADYLDDHAAYYVRCFTDYPRRCRRLHFFSVEVTCTQIHEAIEGDDDCAGQLQAAYLGFIVRRPLDEASIGRTALRTYDADGGRRFYPTTLCYRANLFGIPLAVESLAFQQQDRAIAACATVALWCAFQKASEVFSSSAPRPAEITSAASNYGVSSRIFPNTGLDVRSICSAIRSVGLEPEVFAVTQATYLPSLVYAHVSCGIPVILGVRVEGRGYHAITVAGYSLQEIPALTAEVPVSQPVPMVGRRINELYVHDDQVGPFARLRIREGTTNEHPVILSGTWKDRDNDLDLYPAVVIVPVYHKIRVSFVDVVTHLLGLHRLLASILPSSDTLEWDIRIVTLNEHRARIRNNVRLDADARRKTLVSRHPKFIWKSNLKWRGSTVIQLLGDATGLPRSMPIYSHTWFDDTVRNAVTGLLRGPLSSLAKESLAPGLLRQLLDDR